MSVLEPRSITLHGWPLSYLQAGSGPVLLLIHGMGGSLENWRAVIEPLARQHTVVAPDLPGHGASARGGGDYSLGAFAAGLRDLLFALGLARATLVGHSLGGGIAMQFAYQFPEITRTTGARFQRRARSRGEPDPARRGAAGRQLGHRRQRRAGQQCWGTVARGLGLVGLRPKTDVAEIARGYASLADRDRRAAFLATLRAVIDTGGQRIHGGDRHYLAEGTPILIIWGERDPMIPLQHGQNAHKAIPGSRLEVFEGVRHLPQLEAPGHFIAVLERFIAETRPARFDSKQWRGRLLHGEP